MKLLIDTHVLIWWSTLDHRLSKKARAILDSEEDGLIISAVSAWELAIKSALGKVDLSPSSSSQDFMQRLADDGRFQMLHISWQHAAAVEALPALHSDPFDRLLIAQAQCENLTLLTNDRQIGRYDVTNYW